MNHKNLIYSGLISLGSLALIGSCINTQRLNERVSKLEEDHNAKLVVLNNGLNSKDLKKLLNINLK